MGTSDLEIHHHAYSTQDSATSENDAESELNITRAQFIAQLPTCSSALEDCSICYEPLLDAVKLACDHVYCRECITTWLEHKNTCPMDRRVLYHISEGEKVLRAALSVHLRARYSEMFQRVTAIQVELDRVCELSNSLSASMQVETSKLLEGVAKLRAIFDKYEEGEEKSEEDQQQTDALCAEIKASSLRAKVFATEARSVGKEIKEVTERMTAEHAAFSQEVQQGRANLREALRQM